jgi:hypothetical protein
MHLTRLILVLAGCSAATTPAPDAALPDSAVPGSRFKVQAWADNWFVLWVGETKVGLGADHHRAVLQ